MKSTREQVQEYELKQKMRSMVEDDSIYDFIIISANKHFMRGYFLGTIVTLVAIAIGATVIGG